MANRTDLLVNLALEFHHRGISPTIEPKLHWWTTTPVPTLTGDAYLGHVEVTVDTRGTYRWLDRNGAVRLARPDDIADVVARIIEDRAGTMAPPETDPTAPAPLPRRTDPSRHRPMAK